MNMHAVRGAAVASAIAVCGSAGAVMAQTAPSFGQALGNETLDGVVVRFVPRTPYELGLRDDNGYLDTVRLHDKTLVFPIGLELHLGMRVRVLGFNGGSAFTANEIESVLPPPSFVPEPSWYGEWDGTIRTTAAAGFQKPTAPSFVSNPPAPRFVNPPAPSFVNPPAPP